MRNRSFRQTLVGSSVITLLLAGFFFILPGVPTTLATGSELSNRWSQSNFNIQWSSYPGNGYGVESFSSDPGLVSWNDSTLTLAAKRGANGSWIGPRYATNSSYLYGSFEARILVPAAQGSWPAFWLTNGLSQWATAEIDIMETINKATTDYATIHGWNHTTELFARQATSPLTSGWHTYKVDWKQNKIVFLLDGNMIGMFTPANTPSWPFNTPMQLVLDQAVGGSWAGSPDATTPDTLPLQVNWVRINGNVVSSTATPTNTSSPTTPVTVTPTPSITNSVTPSTTITPTPTIIPGSLAGYFAPVYSGTPDHLFSQQHYSILSDATSSSFLRIFFPAGSSAPSCGSCTSGGAQIAVPIASGPANDFTLTYSVRFPVGFQWVKGGKLPGLCGGACNSGGTDPNGTDGWSQRLMWRANGAAEVYSYTATTKGYGNDLGLGSWYWQADGAWHTVSETVHLNTPGVPDGSVTITYDGKLVSTNTGILYRTVGTLRIDRLFFSTFYGGHDSSWAPTVDQTIDFANFS